MKSQSSPYSVSMADLYQNVEENDMDGHITGDLMGRHVLAHCRYVSAAWEGGTNLFIQDASKRMRIYGLDQYIKLLEKPRLSFKVL